MRCTAAKLSNNFGRKAVAAVRLGREFGFLAGSATTPVCLSETFYLVRFFVSSGFILDGGGH
jgi:hypothetical protein